MKGRTDYEFQRQYDLQAQEIERLHHVIEVIKKEAAEEVETVREWQNKMRWCHLTPEAKEVEHLKQQLETLVLHDGVQKRQIVNLKSVLFKLSSSPVCSYNVQFIIEKGVSTAILLPKQKERLFSEVVVDGSYDKEITTISGRRKNRRTVTEVDGEKVSPGPSRSSSCETHVSCDCSVSSSSEEDTNNPPKSHHWGPVPFCSTARPKAAVCLPTDVPPAPPLETDKQLADKRDKEKLEFVNLKKQQTHLHELAKRLPKISHLLLRSPPEMPSKLHVVPLDNAPDEEPQQQQSPSSKPTSGSCKKASFQRCKKKNVSLDYTKINPHLPVIQKGGGPGVIYKGAAELLGTLIKTPIPPNAMKTLRIRSLRPPVVRDVQRNNI